MRISLYLMDGREIRLDAEPDAWIAAFEQALQGNKALQVNDPEDGRRMGINPRTVLYWKIEPDRPIPEPFSPQKPCLEAESELGVLGHRKWDRDGA